MRRKIALSLAILIALLGCGPGAPRSLEAETDRLLQEFSVPQAPGAAVAVVYRGQVLLIKGYGSADLERALPVTPETNFRLASLTKQFTAMAIMLLASRGALEYDESLPEIFEGFPNYGANITVRHLLGHTSGLSHYEDLLPEGRTSQVSDAEVLDWMIGRDTGDFAAGSRYEYSNTGYAVLSQIVEKRSGKAFARFLEDEIFTPLGMAGTLAFEEGKSAVPNRAMGYSLEGGRFELHDQSLTSAVLGDGGVYSSVRDLVKWDAALESATLLPTDRLKEAFTPGRLSDGQGTGYGFGWEIDRYKGRLRLFHTGTTVGFRNAIVRLPEERLMVVILTNRSQAEPLTLCEAIADWVLDQPSE